MQFTHTHKYITRYITHTRARLGRLRLRWSEIWTPFRGSFLSLNQLKVIARNAKVALGLFVQISLQLASHQLVRLPLFLSARELLFCRKSFPPVWGSHDDCGPAGGNIHWQTSTV